MQINYKKFVHINNSAYLCKVIQEKRNKLIFHNIKDHTHIMLRTVPMSLPLSTLGQKQRIVKSSSTKFPNRNLTFHLIPYAARYEGFFSPFGRRHTVNLLEYP